MCGPYWSQWDKSDLDSWQGKDYPGHDEEDEIDYDVSDDEDEDDEPRGCSAKHPCSNCMDCCTGGWSDFM